MSWPALGSRGVEVVPPSAATREQLLRVDAGEHLRRISETAAPAPSARCRHLHIARVPRMRAHGRCRRARPSTVRSAARSAARSRWCRRRAMMPSAIARWGAVSSTTSLSPPRTRARNGAAKVAMSRLRRPSWQRHAARREDPQRALLSTQAVPCYPGTGAAGEVGARRRRGTHGEPAAGESGAVNEDYQIGVRRGPCSGAAHRSSPISSSCPADFDAHQRDPLAGMRLSTRRRSDDRRVARVAGNVMARAAWRWWPKAATISTRSPRRWTPSPNARWTAAGRTLAAFGGLLRSRAGRRGGREPHCLRAGSRAAPVIRIPQPSKG